jgi:predicted RecA/RadA family phage recombinase
MRNAIQRGGRYTMTVPTGGAVGGRIHPILTGAAGFVGVWLQDYAAGQTGVLLLGADGENGVFEPAKEAGVAFNAFQIIYWDAANSRLTTSATGNTRAGRAFGAAGSADTKAKILLNR